MKILIIDDDRGVRKFIRKALSKLDYTIFDAENGEIALNAMSDEENFDLAIVDILMPEKEGLETIREIKNLYPEMKIIAMSGGGQIAAEQYLQLADYMGADAVIKKPFIRKDLINKIEEVSKDKS